MEYIGKKNDLVNDNISLKEFCDLCLDLGDINSKRDLIQLVPALMALSNNDKILEEFYIEELKDIHSFKKKQASGIVQTLTLAKLHNCDIRLVLWPHIESYDPLSSDHRFAYGAAHDHNFNFISVGYSGPGYITEMYEYDRGSLNGVLGESVNMSHIGDYTLSKGDVMIYEAYKDIHIQRPPMSLSSTINVIPNNGFLDYQYFFDLEKKTLISIIEESSQEAYLRKLIKIVDSQYALNAYNERFGKA